MAKRLASSVVLAMALAMAMAVSAQAASDTGNAPPTLSFYSGGGGANAHWQNDPNDSPNDDNTQDIEINTSVAPNGFAGVTVHHVAGIPTEAYPNSSFEVKSNVPAPSVPSLGSPRLVVRFSDGGRAELRPLNNTPEWQEVADPNWDDNGGTCGFQFQTSWNNVQACHAGTVVTDVFIATDPYGFTYWIDNLNTAGKVFNEAADNGGSTGH
jgi:hypothetical protein